MFKKDEEEDETDEQEEGSREKGARRKEQGEKNKLKLAERWEQVEGSREKGAGPRKEFIGDSAVARQRQGWEGVGGRKGYPIR